MYLLLVSPPRSRHHHQSVRIPPFQNGIMKSGMLLPLVSTSTRTDGVSATSDEVFGDGMARLGNGLQNWVIVNFRKVKLGKVVEPFPK